MSADVSKISLAVNALETLDIPTIDYVVDLFFETAVDFGRLECVGHDGLHFVLGKNERVTFDFDDAVGRFRSVLARVFRRCKMVHPYQLSGGVYGFEADVMMDYGEGFNARFRIRTKNQQAFPELVIEVIN